MPKNKKSKTRFSKSVTRSGRTFSAPSESTGQLMLDLAVDRVVIERKTPLSGLKSLVESPVSPLLAGPRSDLRWSNVNISANFESFSKENNTGTNSDNSVHEILDVGVERNNTTEALDVANKESVGNLDSELCNSIKESVDGHLATKVIVDKVEVSHMADANHSPSYVNNCTQGARENASQKPLPAVAVPSSFLASGSCLPSQPVTPHIKQSKLSYVSCFSSLPRCAGSYTPRVFTSSLDNPNPPPDIVLEGAKVWKDHLVGFFLDSEIPNLDVRTLCRKAWNLRGGLSANIVNGIYYFKFTIFEERRKVLESDPTIIGGKPFIITSWTPTVERARERVPSIPVWTIFTRIPSVLQTLSGMNWLASRIGNFKCFDANTETRKNLIFGKALIEISPSKPLPKKLKVSIDGYDFFVEVQYSWQPEICTKCHCFGHLLESCKLVCHSKVRTPLMKPPPSIWVRKEKEIDNLVEKEPCVDIASKGNESISDDELKKNEVVSSDEASVDDGICWMSDDRTWVHEVSGMRYDPHENEYYKYVSDAVEDARRLEYHVVGDSFELIQEGVLGEKNQTLFHDASWDWECEFRSPNPCFVPNLAVLFSEYVNVIGSDGDSSSYSTLVGD